MELSVIIPIYKTEEYIEACVNSILSYPSAEVEIILVDDGSPDRCPQICDIYAKTDSRVKVIHKENGGLSSARNAGMSVAIGKYITFVDSDDLICTESLSGVLDWIRSGDADLCFLQAEKFYPDGTHHNLGECIESDKLHGCRREDALKHLASRPKYPGSAWAKLYRRDFLLENNLHFPYDRRYSEDVGFIRDCILCAERFDAVMLPFYWYRQNRQGSITNQIKLKNFNDLFLFVVESVEKLDAKKHGNSICESMMSFVAYEYSILLFLYYRIPREDRKEALRKLQEYSWTLKYAGTKKTWMVYMVCRCFGIRAGAFLLNQYRRVVEK